MAQPKTPTAGRKAKPATHESEASPETITTAIHIPKQAWSLLRAVAFHRAQEHGGRASVSKVIADLVERHRIELEKEVRRELMN